MIGKTIKLGWLTLGALLAFGGTAQAQQINEVFNTIPATWVITNHSNPVGTTTWFQPTGTPPFPANSGTPLQYIAANFNNTAGAGVISNWLLTPQVTLVNGMAITFFTRTISPANFPDRLQVRVSTTGMSTNVGVTENDVGDFTFLLLDINPNLTTTGYPTAWTQQTATVTGLPMGSQSGRVAFRYFVTDGGPAGANSDFIGLDDVIVPAIPAVCGNTVVEGMEQCDDGNMSNTDMCTNTCKLATCGDTFVQTGVEQCDDGNMSNTDACVAMCKNATCGDGFVRMGTEACDDANMVNGDGCDNNCTVSACGNGVVGGTEICDDGNMTNGDGCDNNCTATSCGNGIVTGMEVCDDGNTTNADGCDVNCTVTACGNGVTAGTETCDDGNMVNGDMCDNNCTMTGCGNGIVTGMEVCDDGNLMSGDNCDSNCTVTACGNGIITMGEVCDDGNMTNGDMCDNNCTVTACGNGIMTDRKSVV